MRYSLLSRFQGGLLGSEIADLLTNSNDRESGLASRLLSFWLESECLEGVDWREIYQKQRISGEKYDKINQSKLAVLLLPLVLFFHDSPHRLETQLRLFLNAWEMSQDSWPELLLWGHIISLTLQDRLQPNRLIPQLLEISTPLKPQLEQLQYSLEQNLPLAQAIAEIGRAHV